MIVERKKHNSRPQTSANRSGKDNEHIFPHSNPFFEDLVKVDLHTDFSANYGDIIDESIYMNIPLLNDPIVDAPILAQFMLLIPRYITARLRDVQRRLDRNRSSYLVHLESHLQIELEQILDHEELIWKQKYLFDWISLGDQNTSYFHKKVTLNKRANHTTSLKIGIGALCDDDDILHEEAFEFFQQLFELDNFPPENFLYRVFSRSFPFAKMIPLERISDTSDIRNMLFAMAPLKLPGPDGLHTHFFQTNWDIIGGSICDMISNVFSRQDIDPRLNSTILVLIPKVSSPSSFTNFRSISLCSALYKLFTKILVRRI
ncbi:hypothetical protein V6N13_039784 [Hibiscus sabdariffa]